MIAPGRGEFTCPVCGSHYFRTDVPRQRGQCKGAVIRGPHGMHDYTGCSFSWDRADDARVFERAVADDGTE